MVTSSVIEKQSCTSRAESCLRGSVMPASRYAAFADQINPSYTTVSPGYVSSVHAFDGPHGGPLEVFTWTVNDADTARQVAGYGVDGIITNSPDVVRDAFPAA